MALLLDLFGYLTVILRGLANLGLGLTIGGVAFLLLLAEPLAPSLGPAGATLVRRSRGLLAAVALAFAAVQAGIVALNTAVLAESIGIGLAEALAANAALAGMGMIAAGLAVAALALRPGARLPRVPVLLLAAVLLAGAVAVSHAAGRPEGRFWIGGLYALHVLGASVWIGGIPYFLGGLSVAGDGAALRTVGRRFSRMAMAGVGLLLAGGIGLAIVYIGSLAAFYGTAYGMMVAGKTAMFAGLLLLGFLNFRTVERLRRDPATPVLRLRRFAEVEVGVGIVVFLAAASLTSVPPGVDLVEDRVTLAEIGERLAPAWPRLTSPDHDQLALSVLQARLDEGTRGTGERPLAFVFGSGQPAPRNAHDVAWSEYNHNWAGIFVLVIAVAALLDRSGRAPWARHWPLLFLLLAAFLVIRSDPDSWPLGEIPFLDGLRDPEIMQHRLTFAVVIAFSVFEWRVRTGRARAGWTPFVFPVLVGVGGALLITHTHSLANYREQLLIEISHLAIGLLGVMAAAGRWLELRLPGRRAGRAGGWLWPLCFLLIGFMLLVYRES